MTISKVSPTAGISGAFKVDNVNLETVVVGYGGAPRPAPRPATPVLYCRSQPTGTDAAGLSAGGRAMTMPAEREGLLDRRLPRLVGREREQALLGERLAGLVSRRRRDRPRRRGLMDGGALERAGSAPARGALPRAARPAPPARRGGIERAPVGLHAGWPRRSRGRAGAGTDPNPPPPRAPDAARRLGAGARNCQIRSPSPLGHPMNMTTLSPWRAGWSAASSLGVAILSG